MDIVIDYPAPSSRIALDDTERRMIELLQQDGRLSIAQLARGRILGVVATQ
ncbi:MAG: AsnC family transcriptional regulator [Longispora sp.]|nr:AsnC family transcriptional regulator [Longispora sp. (in: high G+C Gram-positive bacteria)]